MRSIRAFAIFPLLLCACGGGGGGGGGGGSAAQQVGTDLLEDCGFPGIRGFLQTLGISVSVVDPNGTSIPAIEVMAADQVQGHILWALDVGGDPAPDLLGDIQFFDDTGQPAAPPFDLNQFVGVGLATLDQFLDQLPDGWRIAFTINAVLPPLIIANLSFTYTAGAVSSVGGNVTVADAPCSTAFSFTGAALSDLVGAFPRFTFTSSYLSTGAMIEGTTTFDGTDVATVDGQVDGAGRSYGYDLDLGAETVTALP